MTEAVSTPRSEMETNMYDPMSSGKSSAIETVGVPRDPGASIDMQLERLSKAHAVLTELMNQVESRFSAVCRPDNGSTAARQTPDEPERSSLNTRLQREIRQAEEVGERLEGLIRRCELD